MRTRILCRFQSPACNPKALLELVNLGATIRDSDRLHAKLYLAGSAVIVGSSNPSRYGLTQEGDIIGGTIEGNLLTDDPDTLAKVSELFDDIWNDMRATSPVTKRIIEQEIRRRDLTPPPAPVRSLVSRTLLSACREAPELFNDVFVCAYDSDMGDGGKAALRNLRKRATGSGPSGRTTADFRNAWGYQFESPPPDGAWLIDVNCRGRKPRICGASRVPSPALHLKVPDEYDMTPTVRSVVTVVGARGRFPITAEEKAQLESIGNRLLKQSDLVPLSKAVRMIDRAEKLARRRSDTK